MRLERFVVFALALACTDKTTDGTTVIPLPTGDTGDEPGSPTGDSGTDTETGTTVDPAGVCADIPVPAEAIAVAAGANLQTEVDNAPSGATLALAAGTYALTSPVVITKPLTLLSADGDPDSVIIDGNYVASELFRVRASDVTIAQVTLTQGVNALVQVLPDATDVLRTRVHGVKMIDPSRAGITTFSGVDDYPGPYADDGEISCNTLELTPAGRGEVFGVCDITGVELYASRGWTVRDNFMKSLYCPRVIGKPAILATRGSRDTRIIRNQLVDVSDGIVIGETQDQIGRVYADNPCGAGVRQSIDGWVVNNIIAAYDEDMVLLDPDDVPAGRFRAGIRAESSCNVSVLHNSVYTAIDPFLEGGAIEQRYATTTGLIANNFLTHASVRYPKAAADELGNFEEARLSDFFFPSNDDFGTSPGATNAIDKGDPVTVGLVTDDVDGEPRDDGLPDLGADEVAPLLR